MHEVHAQRTVDRYAEPTLIDAITRELLAGLHAQAAKDGARLIGHTVELSVHYEHDSLARGEVLVRATAPAEPIPEAGSPLTLAEHAELADLAAAVGVPENCRATPEQAVQMLRIARPELAARWVEQWQRSSEDAMRCWEQNHVGQLEQYRERALQEARRGA